jgi:acetoin utilization protein AcuB
MKTNVQSYTSRNLIVTRWTDSIEDAYLAMRAKGIRHLPVVDDHGLIVGVISDRDMQRAMQVEQPDFTSGYPAKATFDPTSTVRDYMSWPVESVEDRESVTAAAKRMIEKKISALLVTRRSEVIGIITTEDLLRALVLDLETTVDRVRGTVEEFIYGSAVGPITQAVSSAGI